MGRRPTVNIARPGEYEDRWIIGREAMSLVLGLSSSAVSKLTEQGLPKVSNGKYSIPHCVQWYVDIWRQRSNTAQDPTNKDGLDLRSRLTLAQAEKYELDTEIARGHYAPVETVEHAMSEAAASLAASLDGLGARLAGVLADETEPAQVQATLTAETRLIRDDYASNLAQWADEVAGTDPENVPDAGGDTASAARPDG